MPLIVRDATPADVPAIAALYADEVRDHVNTYEYDVPDEGEILQVGRFEVEVVDMDDRRIDKLIFKELVKAEAEREAIAAHLED